MSEKSEVRSIQTHEIKKGALITVDGIPEVVYTLHDIVMTERGLWLVLERFINGVRHTREQRPWDCLLYSEE